ncbi:MAG: type I restriction endonuclease [Candidatus Nanopelagicales bacterium]
MRTAYIRLIDFDHPANNDWLAVNQFTIVGHKTRRPDVLVFVNGIPLGAAGVEEPGGRARDAAARVEPGADLPHRHPGGVHPERGHGDLGRHVGGDEFVHRRLRALRAVEDDRRPRGGHRTGPRWRCCSRACSSRPGSSTSCATSSCSPTSRTGMVKRVAKYHQYWAVNAAVESTVVAAGEGGDRRGGVVWHTQGSGKSIEMLLYAAKVMRDPRMGNPTLVFLTDRNDLDDQLFGEVFAPAEILPEKPVQADSRARPARAAAAGLRRDRLHHAAEVRARWQATTSTRS